MIKMNGYDDCILGICHQFGRDTIIAYDLEKVLAKLMEDDMTYEEAIEFWEYNQVGAYVGETTPCFIQTDNFFIPAEGGDNE